ncbi:MAG TPA: hypothetical protein VEA59_06090 [Patescibacteria group bacterium]|nr:hypothetical protein [Patescibacteria group bacterium]
MKKICIIISVLLLVSVIGNVLLYLKWNAFKTGGAVATNPYSDAVLANDTLPSQFPKDLPIESEAVVTSTYATHTEDGRSGAVREYTSKLSPTEVVANYKSFAYANNWTVTIENVESGNSSTGLFSAVKDNQTLEVSIAPLDTNQGLRVKVTVLQAY